LEQPTSGQRPNWVEDPQKADIVNILDVIFTCKEDSRWGRLPANSVPGPDGVTFHTRKTLDPRGKLLTIIYNIYIYWKREEVPDSWKVSTTILAYKNRGDRLDLTNWRPICLQNTIYKIYVATVAKRIATWAMTTNTIISAQKVFAL